MLQCSLTRPSCDIFEKMSVKIEIEIRNLVDLRIEYYTIVAKKVSLLCQVLE